MRNWMMAVAAMAVAAPASAQVALRPGQGVTLTIGANGEARASAPRTAALTAADLDAVGLMRKSYAIDKTVANAPPDAVLPPIEMQLGDAVPIVPGQVEIVFAVVDGHTVLALRNGYDRAVRYRATMQVRGRSQPTDVCIVLPGKRGYEHWPYVMEGITLTSFALEAWKPGDPIRCE